MIETTLLATSEKLCPFFAKSTFGGPRNSFGMKRRKNASIDQSAFLRAQIRAQGFPPLQFDGQRMAGLVEVGTNRRQPFVSHQHQEPNLWEISRGVRVKTAGPVLDGIEPVGRDGLAD